MSFQEMKRIFYLYFFALILVTGISCNKKEEYAQLSPNPDGKSWVIFDEDDNYKILDLTLGNGECLYLSSADFVNEGQTILYSENQVIKYLVMTMGNDWVIRLYEHMASYNTKIIRRHYFLDVGENEGLLLNGVSKKYRYQMRVVNYKTERTPNVFRITRVLDRYSLDYDALTNDYGLAAFKNLSQVQRSYPVYWIYGNGSESDYKETSASGRIVTISGKDIDDYAEKSAIAAEHGAVALAIGAGDDVLFTKEMMDSLPTSGIPIMILSARNSFSSSDYISFDYFN